MLWGVSALKCSIFQKKLIFPDFQSIEPVFRSIEIVIKIFYLSLPDSIDVQSILDQSQLKNFQFLCFWPKFFHASFVFRIHMHCIFSYIHLAVLQSYLSLFSHIPCIHFAKLGTQLDLKIDWLIFESSVHFSICYFLCVNYWNIFWDMMNNQCANIFSTHATVYGSHSVKFAFIKRENIFLQVNSHFFSLVCIFLFIPTS